MQTVDHGSTGAVDWEAIERSEDFQELVRRKRRYVVPRVIFFLAWYLAFVLLSGYAEDFMNERVYEGLTVGYVLALSQFVMVWFLAVSYVRKADRDFEPLEHRVADHHRAEVERAEAAVGDGRFHGRAPARTPAATHQEVSS
jgi:uncharacterized membrane protein (DUF485 family)